MRGCTKKREAVYSKIKFKTVKSKRIYSLTMYVLTSFLPTLIHFIALYEKLHKESEPQPLQHDVACDVVAGTSGRA